MFKMQIHNWFLFFIAMQQIVAGAYFWVKLKSPLLGLLQITYAISNIIFSMMRGL